VAEAESYEVIYGLKQQATADYKNSNSKRNEINAARKDSKEP